MDKDRIAIGGQNTGHGEDVLFQVKLPGGEILRLVREEDELLTIQQSGRVLPGCYWRDDEVDRAIREFRLISHRLLPPS